jgi:hypothetical protein
MAIEIVPTKEGMKDIDRSTFKDVDAMTETPMSVEVDGEILMMTPSEIQKMISQGITINLADEKIPPAENMGMESMSEESKIIFDALTAQGLEPSTAIEIMARDTIDSMGKIGLAGGVRPEEFGGLPKVPPLTGSSPDAMATAGAGMSQGAMASYLANKVNDIRARTGSAPIMPTTQPVMPQQTNMEQNRRGALPTGMMGAT